MIEKEAALIQAVDEPYLQSKAGDNTIRPENQHGKKAGPKRLSDTEVKDFLSPATRVKLTELDYGDFRDALLKVYDDVKLDVLDYIGTKQFVAEQDMDWCNAVIRAAMGLIRRRMAATHKMYTLGLRDGGFTQSEHQAEIHLSVLLVYFDNYVDRIENKLVAKMNSVDKENAVPEVGTVFDSLRYRVKFMARSLPIKAYNYGFAIGLRSRGYKFATIDKGVDACDDCATHPDHIALEYVTPEDVPTWHPLCGCLVTGGAN